MIKKSLYIFSLAVVFFSCKEEEEKEKTYVYQVQDVYVEQPGADKSNVKESKQYISIAYSDVYGKTIPADVLNNLTTAYIALGDVAVVEDLIIRNFLNDTQADIPTDAEMRADIPAFVKKCFNQFYSREPNEQELWYFQKKISENTGLTPDVLYYTFLTSNEYRQF